MVTPVKTKSVPASRIEAGRLAQQLGESCKGDVTKLLSTSQSRNSKKCQDVVGNIGKLFGLHPPLRSTSKSFSDNNKAKSSKPTKGEITTMRMYGGYGKLPSQLPRPKGRSLKELG